jgi:hypothetical protein
LPHCPPAAIVLLTVLRRLLERRYIHERLAIPKSTVQMDICLEVFRVQPQFFERFRLYARMYPATFDALCTAISSHHVFSSRQPWHEQIPVEKQLLIALQRFGTYRNAGCVKRIAAWAGVAEGTVDLCTRRVMCAILDNNLRSTYIQWPSQAQREAHKQAVEDLTCKE